jgi:hypothetical protein
MVFFNFDLSRHDMLIAEKFEISGFVSLWAMTIILFLLGAGTLLVFDLYRKYGGGSAHFSRANASTYLSRKIDHLLNTGTTLYFCAGKGTYPINLKPSLRTWFSETMRDWTSRCKSIKVFLTNPSEEAVEYWQSSVNELHNDKFEVYILDSSKTEDPFVVRQISSLEHFHPTLLKNADNRNAMWIENFHEPDSTVAYNVQYVAPADFTEFQKARFKKYMNVFDQLSNSGLHVSRLVPHSNQTGANGELARAG